MPTIDDAEITERKHKRQAKESAEAVIGLSIADRLTRRAKAKTVELPMNDEDGDFAIVLQQPTRAEMEDLRLMQLAIQNEGTQDAANEGLCKALDHLCVDTSLDYAYWMAGNYDMVDLIDIVNKLFESLTARVKEAQSFRED